MSSRKSLTKPIEVKRTKAGLIMDERVSLRSDLKKFVLKKAKLLGYPEEAIVQEIRYWQQSVKDWCTNATKAQQVKSFKFTTESAGNVTIPLDFKSVQILRFGINEHSCKLLIIIDV